jgi:hypothetical protein
MSAFIKIPTLEYPRHEGDIRLEYPEILETQTGDTFPCPETYAKVIQSSMPVYNYLEQKCLEQFPQNIDGVWTQVWQVFNLTEEEKQQQQQQQTISNSIALDTIPGNEPSVIQ